MIRHAVTDTKLGWIGMVSSGKGLTFITLPEASRKASLSKIKGFVSNSVEDVSAFGDLPSRLQHYFTGNKVNFPDRLDLSGATAFQQVVWNLTRAIPYGETRSYAWVARLGGSPGSSRAVGGALARNRFPIIVPCHRVVASDGSLGGFSGGKELKKQLLNLEAVAYKF